MKNILMLIAAAALLLPAPARCEDPAAGRDIVYTIPIRGMIEPALLYVIRRGLSEADACGAKAIVFVMDTPGGTVDAATEIVHAIQDVKVPTYTFVERSAFSAGAIIALSTKHIYLAPGTVIGDAMPIMMTPVGGGVTMQPTHAIDAEQRHSDQSGKLSKTWSEIHLELAKGQWWWD